jgi:hypothetical protein
MYFHSCYEPDHIFESKKVLEEITGKKIYGFRMPLLKKIELKRIKDAGYNYDSSINPTFIPGRYNNYFTPRKFYKDTKENIFVLPFSVSPVFRIPLFWLSFKNFNFSFYLCLCKYALARDHYLHLYFHPWEFADLKSFPIPEYIKRYSGSTYTTHFEKLIKSLKQKGEFITIHNFLMNQ